MNGWARVLYRSFPLNKHIAVDAGDLDGGFVQVPDFRADPDYALGPELIFDFLS
jgi:hypothetical protein